MRRNKSHRAHPFTLWHLGTVAELMGEEPSRLGDPSSKSIGFIERYTTEMVQRYNNSPAIWGWEFGNEANLGVDLATPRWTRDASGR